MGDRLLRAVEKWVTPYRRDEAEKVIADAEAAVRAEEEKAVRTEAMRRRAVATRIRIERLYGERRDGRRA